MRTRSDSVSIHPYFKVHAGQMAAFKALFPKFIAATKSEPKCLYYGFTVSDDVVHCREAYADAEGLLAHVQNVGALIEQALKLSDIARLEVHGPAAELEKLKGPLGSLNPQWFAYETGLSG
jgi:quinol monooxygenase YgiN